MSSGSPTQENQDATIAELVGLTGLSTSEAEQLLISANGDLSIAATLFFDQDQDHTAPDEEEEPDVDMATGEDEPQQPTPAPPRHPGGGYTLNGTYIPPEASSSSSNPSSGPQPPQRGTGGLRTLKDLQTQSGGGHGHAHDDDHGSDEDKDDENQDFFAGGEKSGLAVQNPNQAANPRDHINNIIRRARQNAPRPGGDDERPATRFTGSGMTLGGDDAPSRIIPDPHAAAPQPAPRAHRELHLWRDGFSVDDGPLFRYDDPANADTLEMINNGHAPLAILNVEPGQEVDVEVHAHKDQDYVQPKKKWAPFGGSGQRLGSPTPGATSTPAPAPAATSSTTAVLVSTGAARPSVGIDSSVPTITLQIRLGDGSRLQSRFNTTHTVGDVYSFVNATSPASTQRAYALMTTFPSKELTDKSQALGDMAEFKRGGVVVQKWK